MLDMKDVTNTDDVSQWVQGGYFLFDSAKYGKLKIASLCAGPSMTVGTPSGSGWAAKLLPEGDIEAFSDQNKIHPTWPMCGAINLVHTRNAVWVDRLPKKQWKRTFVFTCISIVDAAGSTVPYANMPAYEKNLICSIFEPLYFSYKDFKNNDWATGAINPALVLRRGIEDIKVYLYADYVGSIKKDKFTAISPTIERKVLQQLGGDVSGK